jgi:hypothetical protein
VGPPRTQGQRFYDHERSKVAWGRGAGREGRRAPLYRNQKRAQPPPRQRPVLVPSTHTRTQTHIQPVHTHARRLVLLTTMSRQAGSEEPSTRWDVCGHCCATRSNPPL